MVSAVPVAAHRIPDGFLSFGHRILEFLTKSHEKHNPQREKEAKRESVILFCLYILSYLDRILCRHIYIYIYKVNIRILYLHILYIFL